MRLAPWVKWAAAFLLGYFIMKDPSGTAAWFSTTFHQLSTFVGRL